MSSTATSFCVMLLILLVDLTQDQNLKNTIITSQTGLTHPSE